MKKYFDINIKFLILFSIFTFSFILDDFPMLGYILYYLIPGIYILCNFHYVIDLLKRFFNRKYIIIIVLLAAFVIATIGIPILKDTSDFSYFTIKVMDTLKTLYRLLFVVFVFKKHISPEGNIELFFKYFIYSCCLYVFFTIVTIAFPDFKLFWFNLIRQTELQENLVYKQVNYISRFGWTGFAGFTQTYYCTLAIILQSYITLKHVKDMNWKDCTIFCILFLGNMFYGRTGMFVSVGMLGIFFISLLFRNRKWAFRFLGMGIVAFIIVTILGNIVPILKPWYQWVFSMFYSYSEGNGLTTESAEIMTHRMIFMPKMNTFLFGDGFYTVNDAYYMRTDIGFMRPLLFGGIFFSIIRYLVGLVTIALYASLRYQKCKNYLELMLCGQIALLMIIVECKGEILENTIIWILLFMCIEFLNDADKKVEKICFLVDDISKMRGGNRVAVNLANELSTTYELYYTGISGKNKEVPFVVSKKVRQHAFYENYVRMRTNMIGGSLLLRKYIKKNKIDLVLSVGASMNLYMVISTLGMRTKKVFCEHSNLKNTYHNDTMQKICQFIGAYLSDRLITLTEKDRENYLIKYHLPKDKVLSIYNWMEPIEDDDKLSKNDNIIISVGALEPVKGYERLITIAASILKNHKDWKWEVYGEGDDQYKGKINTLIAVERLQDRIMLMGNTMDILSKYQNSKICVLTSHFEGLPMVLLEALSCGLPVVSFDVETGPNEIIINGVNGYLVEDNREKEMIDKIEQLIDNEDELAKMATNARESISKFSKNKILKQWNKLIEEI